MDQAERIRTQPQGAGRGGRPLGRLLLALVMASVLVAAACGSDGEDTAPRAAPPAPATTASTAAEAADTDPAETGATEADAAAAEPADTGEDAAEQIGGDLNLYNWTDYISEDLLARFSDETGIAVNLSNYDSNETMLAALAAGATGYDVIVPSDYIIPQLIEQAPDPAD